MAKIHLMGAALVAAAVVAGCCDKDNCKMAPAEAGTAAKTEAKSEEPAKDPNEVVLQVGDTKLTRGQVDADTQKVVAYYAGKIPADKIDAAKQQISMDIVRRFMQETALGAKATALGYVLTDADLQKHEAELAASTKDRPDAPKTFAELAAKHPFGAERAMAELKNDFLIEKMLLGEVINKDTKDYAADAAKIIERVKKNNESCMSDADALKKIQSLKAELDATPAEKKAEKFAELAKANSACPSSAKGGDLGEFTHGQMVPEFDTVSFKQDVGQISDPVKTQFGYHLILTTKKTPAVEAKGDEPATPEKVQASHILIKVSEPEKVPEQAEVVDMIKKNANRQNISEFVQKTLQEAQITAAPEFALVLPPPAAKEEPEAEKKPTEKPAETAVEKPAKK